MPNGLPFGRCVLDDDGISMSSGIAAALIDPLLLFEVGPSVANYEPKDSQGFEQVRIFFSKFSRVRLANREPF
jgi:hypothetical protein